MTFEECRDYVTTAISRGVKAVYLTGGEPLLWSGLRDFLSWYYSLDTVLPLTILTNGTLIGTELAGYFKKFTSQGLTLRISLECYTRENNDDYRGTGSFVRALQGIKNLNEQGIRPWIAYVNKSGGSLDCSGTTQLEEDFRSRLGREHGLEIAGLKIIAAYGKGRFTGEVDYPVVSTDRISSGMTAVQCSYGIAISKNGTYPCPVLVDVPEAKLPYSLRDVVGASFTLDFDFCSSCFATGTRCGQ